MNKLKVAVIGLGSIAKYRHLVEYAANKHVVIAAVCDIVEERANYFAKKYGAAAYTDYNELLHKETVDIVSVCLPNYLHAPVSIAALEANAHVLCEKPMATSKKEAEAMIAAAEKSGKKLMVGHNQRFVASHKKAKELISKGEAGKIYSFRTVFGHSGPETWSADSSNSWFFDKKRALIGAMGDLGVHKADLLRYILSEEFVEVAAFVETSAKENATVDDNAVLILKSESGVIGTLAASWAYTNEDNSTVIYGEKATLRLEEDPVNNLVIQYRTGEVVKYELEAIQSNDADGQMSTGVIDHFIDVIRNDSKPLIDGMEGKKSLEVILGALESVEKQTIQGLEHEVKSFTK